MQCERLLADAGASALAELIGETGAGARLEPQHLEAELLRARDVGERLERVLARAKQPEAIREPSRLDACDVRQFDARLGSGRATDRERFGACLEAAVVQGPLRLDPLG